MCFYIELFFLLGNVQRRFNGRLPLVVSLLQVYKRQQKLDGVGLYAIGFEIFQVCIASIVYGVSCLFLIFVV